MTRIRKPPAKTRYVAQPQNHDQSVWWVTNAPQPGKRQVLAGKNMTEAAAKAMAARLNA